MSGDWRAIIKRIEICRSFRDSNEVLSRLEELFEIEQDGMVAYALGEEHEKSNNLEKALKYYQIAERLFPLPKYKNNARSAIQRVLNLLDTSKSNVRTKGTAPENKSFILNDYNPSDTILIVPCTKTKIWELSPNAPDYVPARHAYKGEGFIRYLDWAEENELENKGYNWVILSGKYGFIEPWHPIGNYDVHIGDTTISISIESLKKQINQKREWRDNEGNNRTIYLKSFTDVICMNCSSDYFNKLLEVFPERKVIKIEI